MSDFVKELRAIAADRVEHLGGAWKAENRLEWRAADALELLQTEIEASAEVRKSLSRSIDMRDQRIKQLEAALLPLAKAHKSDRPYNEITLNDCRVAFELLETTGASVEKSSVEKG